VSGLEELSREELIAFVQRLLEANAALEERVPQRDQYCRACGSAKSGAVDPSLLSAAALTAGRKDVNAFPSGYVALRGQKV
jgi:hypothetical protein